MKYKTLRLLVIPLLITLGCDRYKIETAEYRDAEYQARLIVKSKFSHPENVVFINDNGKIEAFKDSTFNLSGTVTDSLLSTIPVLYKIKIKHVNPDNWKTVYCVINDKRL